MHPVFPRVNVACGATGDCDTAGTAAEQAQYPVVGCYAHATHVAGIIGAKENGAGTVGVYAGVRLRSVSVVKASAPYTHGTGSPLGGNSASSGWCANLSVQASTPYFDSANVGYALDWMYNRILFDNVGVGIVNMSLNTGAVGLFKEVGGSMTPEANHLKLKKLATPAFLSPFGFGQYYAAAFVAQSAGNFRRDLCLHCGSGICTCPNPACDPNDMSPFCNNSTCDHGPSLAYRVDPAVFPNGTDPADGIMVIGGHHHTGEAATYAVAFSQSHPPGVVNAPDSSNFGKCVHRWAPGNSIVSSFGVQQNFGTGGAQTVVGAQYSGNVNQSTSGWLFLSGTSMAAPHVAGAAAYAADAFGLNTPGEIEQKLRTFMYSYGTDPASELVRTIQIP